jgi:1-acyl-sn-glycerol-3-phosphate acyltransferase
MHSSKRPVASWDLMRAAARPVVNVWLRPQVTGTGHVPGSGGVLLAANHLSHLDILLLAVTSPRTPRFLGKHELATGWVGRLATLSGMVPVDRGRGDLSPVLRVIELLRAGAVIAIFPEGTRSRDGRLYRFRSGLARAAAAAQVPTVPVSLYGTAQVWPRGARPDLHRQPPGSVGIRYGEVIAPPEPTPVARRAFTQQVTAAVAGGWNQPVADSFAAVAE